MTCSEAVEESESEDDLMELQPQRESLIYYQSLDKSRSCLKAETVPGSESRRRQHLISSGEVENCFASRHPSTAAYPWSHTAWWCLQA